ncbi:hypothetical protein WS68_18725 [Burkholderia sp. TSV86]|nr:hypothetical protein WS68_18725 [Burkholderia sp. TSV86]
MARRAARGIHRALQARRAPVDRSVGATGRSVQHRRVREERGAARCAPSRVLFDRSIAPRLYRAVPVWPDWDARPMRCVAKQRFVWGRACGHATVSSLPRAV